MKVTRIRSEELAQTAAERWGKQMGTSMTCSWNPSKPAAGEIYEALKSLATPTPTAVASIIGNDSWTTVSCAVCGNHEPSGVALTDEDSDPDRDRSVEICDACLSQLASLARTEPDQNANVATPVAKPCERV